MKNPPMWDNTEVESVFGIGLSQEEINQTLAKAEIETTKRALPLLSKGPIFVLLLAGLFCFVAAVVVHYLFSIASIEIGFNLFYLALIISSVVIPFSITVLVLNKTIIVFQR